MSHDENFSPSILILLGIGLVIVLVGAGMESPDEPAVKPPTPPAQLVPPAPPAPSPTPLGDKERGTLMSEWKTTRELLAKFDDRIHDLGHWGTGFVTGLLAVESFLLSQPSGSTIPLPVPVKMVVVVATLVLIFSLRILQSRHETFQLAAAIRARSIERVLGLELTGVISQAYAIGRLWWLANLQYFFLAVSAGAIGYFAIQTNPIGQIKSESAAIVIGATAVTSILVLLIRRLVKLNVAVYWSTDRTTVSAGESVRITITNIAYKRGLLKNPMPWTVSNQAGTRSHGTTDPQTHMDPGDSIDWLWKPDNPGTYEIKIPRDRRDYFKNVPLRRPILKSFYERGRSVKAALANALGLPRLALGLVRPKDPNKMQRMATITVVPKQEVDKVGFIIMRVM